MDALHSCDPVIKVHDPVLSSSVYLYQTSSYPRVAAMALLSRLALVLTAFAACSSALYVGQFLSIVQSYRNAQGDYCQHEVMHLLLVRTA